MASLLFQWWSLVFVALLPVIKAGTKYLDDSDASAWSFFGDWQAVSSLSPCTGCAAQGENGEAVEANKAYGGTYHYALASNSDPKTGTITFRGNAIQVYGIQFNYGGAIAFSLPGTSGGRYEPPLSSPLVYNTLIFEANGLSEAVDQVLTFSLQFASTNGTATILDYAIVSFTDVIVTTNTSVPTVISTSYPPTTATTTTIVVTTTGYFGQTSIFTTTTVIPLPPSIQVPVTSGSNVNPASETTSIFVIPAASRTTTGSATSSSKASTGVIVGGAIAGAAILAILAIILLLMGRRRSQQLGAATQNPYPRTVLPGNSLAATAHRKQRRVSEGWTEYPQITYTPGPQSNTSTEGRLRQLESEMRQVRTTSNLPPAY
ncbi:hypothetical protein DL96DRAFT_517820 [Flagelloscypha sp. PMI_526]|nr:hypothetical protein DL96DRAFT_517820 [Flagelloscypha sp. PMI_526]